ncbi:MAG TPA: ornithine cyclodeaminase family protein [Bacteroidota bacterium]|nr:ornithine cyclodeaminase family protein [Bacteroidota bacterium]
MMMESSKHTKDGTLLLNREEVCSLIGIDECIDAVERAFKLHGEGRASPPGILGVHAQDGGFHIKTGLLEQDRNFFVAKINANFPQNLKRFGLPTIQGLILVCDAVTGYPLAVMDSIEITIQRTGAATAVAVKYLAGKDAEIVTICGAGNQGRIQLSALLRVRDLTQAFVYDVDDGKARQFAAEFAHELPVEPITKGRLSSAVRESHICVTCTPAREFFLNCDDVAPGTFIAGVGADSEEKQELDPQLFVSNKIIVDVLEQSALIGDLHHAIVAGLVKKSDVHAELGEVVAGRKPGRISVEEIIIFDSTGMALQDAAAAALVYNKAISAGVGTMYQFNSTITQNKIH